MGKTMGKSWENIGQHRKTLAKNGKTMVYDGLLHGKSDVSNMNGWFRGNPGSGNLNKWLKSWL